MGSERHSSARRQQRQAARQGDEEGTLRSPSVPPLLQQQQPQEMMVSNDDTPMAERSRSPPIGPGNDSEQQPEEQQLSVANAALVARGALKSGYLWKMGSNVPRWKRRYFVLKPITMLFYYMSEHDTEPRGCIDLDLFDAVRRVGPSQRQGASKTSRTGSGSGEPGLPRRTAFELYRSGSPEGSGFMLEARGHEDWEQWVETIANGRHGKMQAETDVLKGTNKLLLEEICGLEEQVSTFRGYADQRHVTVLALRDERQRNRDLLAEVYALGDAASSLSLYIEASTRAHAAAERLHDGETFERREDGDEVLHGKGPVGSFDESGASSCPSSADSTSQESVQVMLSSATSVLQVETSQTADKDCEDIATVSTSGTFSEGGSNHSRHSATSSHESSINNNGETETESPSEMDERSSLEALRQALACARSEIDRRWLKMRQEEEARRAIEGRVKALADAAWAAEERATVAETVAARATGRVSVLERNVEYLKRQQQALRAELCQSQQRAQRARAQKAILKREVRDMWAAEGAKSDTSSCSGYTPPRAQPPGTRPRGASASSVPVGLPRARTMGDLAGAAAGPGNGSNAEAVGQDREQLQSVRSRALSANGGMVNVRWSGGVFGSRLTDDRDGMGKTQVTGMRSCLSGVSLACASDGGDTDMAEQTCSEVSDDDLAGEGIMVSRFSPSNKGISLQGTEKVNPLGARIRGTIRRRVGDAEIPPLPPPRHERILEAAKRLRVDVGADAPLSNPPAIGSIETRTGGSAILSKSTPLLESSATAANVPAGGLGVAGMLLSGLGKGMVEKAAQGMMAKKLGLWPGGASGAAGFGSNGRGPSADGRAGSTAAQGGEGSLASSYFASVARPRSTTSLPDYAQLAARFGISSGASVGPSTMDAAAAFNGVGDARSYDVASLGRTGRFVSSPSMGSLAVAGAVHTGASPVKGTVAPPHPPIVGSGGSGSMSPVVSRTALIQLSDLELVEPCGDRPSANSAEGRENAEIAATRGGGKNQNCHGEFQKRMSAQRPCSIAEITNEVRAQMQQETTKLSPVEMYELVFTEQIIGLQFSGCAGEIAVIVSGLKGYSGPALIPQTAGSAAAGGEHQQSPRLRPEIGDVLVSYNGCSATGKSVAVVAREFAGCDRPLTLRFRSTATSGAWQPARAVVSESESETESEEMEWSFEGNGGYPPYSVGVGSSGLTGERRLAKASGIGGVLDGNGVTCAAAQGGIMTDGGSLWREAISIAPQWARS